ncbi:hypothetical protein AAC387_Pa01g1888 [Persea americana]
MSRHFTLFSSPLMGYLKIRHLLMDFSRNLSQFFQWRKACLFTLTVILITLFMFVNRPPANSISPKRILPSLNSPGDEHIFKNTTLVPTVESNENPAKGETIDRSCDIFDGHWVLDETYPYYSPGSCPFIDNGFDCISNGRPDSDYQRLRWEPKGCKIPRLDGNKMLELLRGKRLVFVGDSLNRNMWQSLVCILRDSLEDKNRVFDVSGKREFRTEGFYAFRFADYNCSIEFVRTNFLVQEWEMADSALAKKETLRLDVIDESSTKYKDADIIVFNTAHWWTHDKIGKNYYQERDHVYPELDVLHAYKKALLTWAKWVDANIDTDQTRVFFRAYSANHFRKGHWNSGGTCSGETRPITKDRNLERYPPLMSTLESVLSKMMTPVSYLNITKMTNYRKDGHPSIFRHPGAADLRVEDCSHWCLPGVPDAWNELLYASLLMSGYREQ